MKTTLNAHADDSAAVQVASISNKALTSNVATLTTAAAHGLVTGDRVVVDCSDNVFDGSYAVASTPSGTTFTYALTHANVTSAAATGTVSRVPEFTRLDVPGGRRGQKITVQNLGPGDVSYDFTEPDEGTNVADSGFLIAAGDPAMVIEFGGDLYLSSDANSTDFRYALVP